MSNRSRLGLVAAAAVIVIAAFLALRPDEGSEDADNPATTAQGGGGGGTTERATPAPRPERIVLRGGSPVGAGGVSRIEASKGETVRFGVSSDMPDEIHLHGYDITRRAMSGRPARFRFKADAEGVFEIESHVAEDAGRDPLVGRLVVEP